MRAYIRQYVLEPPSEVRQKRRQSKLNTSSKPNSGVQTQKSRLAKKAKSLAGRLKQSGHSYERILEFPLALCDEFGQMRSRNKSAFKPALLQIPQLLNLFSTTPPVLLTGSEIIIDALKFIHCPLAPSISTSCEYVDLYCTIVHEHGTVHGTKCITVVFDKPMYLPDKTNHSYRERKAPKPDSLACMLYKMINLYGEVFVEPLTIARYKSLLTDYISLSFPILAIYLSKWMR